jgi:uncharacterized membrane protein YeaQ/YmgE (transglycosylase-associated protein family)
MAILTTALANLLIILLIGVVAGLFFNRYSRSWLARIGLLPSPLMHYLLAIVGAVLVLWLWRGK